ncbi:ABC transporter permease [uncultured Intestinimonas sp.]|uniref:ABC transporter permease n=1 Tax=Intestinimonas sp. HCP28S3_D6 TaxID=3438942 RepID=UPI0025FAF5FD|nr:ABC transporter permease [uncultured Intestinimonas sp.]
MPQIGKRKLDKLATSLEEDLAKKAKGLTQAEIDALDPQLFTLADYDAAAAERTGYSNYSYWRSTLRIFWRNKVARLLIILLGLMLLFTFIQPFLPDQKDPTEIFYNEETGMPLSNKQPGEVEGFILGTNNLGQDLWSRTWYATRTSLFIGFVVALSECIIGITVGVLWGYVRRLDQFLTSAYNIVDNVPRTIILILISYILRPSMSTIILSMCLVGWLKMARYVRNQVVIIRDRDYNLASRCLGSSTPRIVYRNLLPYLVSIIMLRAALAVPTAITDEVFLTYIGLGLPVYTPSLGTLIIAGKALMTTPSLSYQLIIPCVALSFVTVCFYVIGNAFADAADPKNHVS